MLFLTVLHVYEILHCLTVLFTVKGAFVYCRGLFQHCVILTVYTVSHMISGILFYFPILKINKDFTNISRVSFSIQRPRISSEISSKFAAIICFFPRKFLGDDSVMSNLWAGSHQLSLVVQCFSHRYNVLLSHVSHFTPLCLPLTDTLSLLLLGNLIQLLSRGLL